jgi:hypothetical protein
MTVYRRYNFVPMAARKPDEKYEEAKAKASTAVAQINDARQKEVAYQAILDDLLMENFTQRYLRGRENCVGVGISLVVAIVGALSLWYKWPSAVSIIVAAFINAEILFLIVLVGLRADGVTNTKNLLPHRLPALLMGFLLFVGLLHSFANIYAKSGGICPGGSECQAADRSKPGIEEPANALYFSCVTMTTLGYGDFSPGEGSARWWVMWQLFDAVLLVVLFLPLVMSRIAAF